MACRAVSLFSGCGGMDVGARAAGFQTVLASEIDKHACASFRKNHPEVTLIEGDVAENINEICDVDHVDLVFGGPPCQGFSVAGKMDPDDPRSKLVFTFCNVVSEIKPKSFVLENVKSLGTLDKFQKIREKIIMLMHNSGYNVSIFVLNSRDYGVPQNRERVFFIGTRKNIQSISIKDIEKHKSKAPTLREAIIHLGPSGSESNPKITKAKITLAAKPVMRKSPYAGMLFNGQGRPLNPDAWSSTLPASMGGNRTPIIDEDHLYSHKSSWVEEYHAQLLKGEKNIYYEKVPKRLRRMTVDEAAIIQSFPRDYIFVGPQSRVFSQIGNAVPCKLASAVFEAVKEKIEGKFVLSKSEQLDFLEMT